MFFSFIVICNVYMYKPITHLHVRRYICIMNMNMYNVCIFISSQSSLVSVACPIACPVACPVACPIAYPIEYPVECDVSC